MNNPYAAVGIQTSTPEELSHKVFNSILLYLQEYKDTSRNKIERKKSLDAACVITEWVVHSIQNHADTYEKELVHYGLNKIYDTISKARLDFDKVYDVNDALGFLKILTKA